MEKLRIKKEIERVLKKQPNKTLDPDIIAKKINVPFFEVWNVGKELAREGHLIIG